jgi:hypothetical protein
MNTINLFLVCKQNRGMHVLCEIQQLAGVAIQDAMYAWWRQYFVTTRDHAAGGTTTRARLTVLDAWPDANETSYGRSLPLEKVLAARSRVPQPFL